MDELFARRAMVEACRTLNASGINQGAAGNISLRFGAKMLITPSGVDYETLDPDMVCAMDLTDDAPARDERTGLIASSEWRFHRDIFRARHDVGAVVHTHAPYATVLSMLRRPIPASHYMIAAFGGRRSNARITPLSARRNYPISPCGGWGRAKAFCSVRTA